MVDNVITQRISLRYVLLHHILVYEPYLFSMYIGGSTEVLQNATTEVTDAGPSISQAGTATVLPSVVQASPPVQVTSLMEGQTIQQLAFYISWLVDQRVSRDFGVSESTLHGWREDKEKLCKFLQTVVKINNSIKPPMLDEALKNKINRATDNFKNNLRGTVNDHLIAKYAQWTRTLAQLDNADYGHAKNVAEKLSIRNNTRLIKSKL